MVDNIYEHMKNFSREMVQDGYVGRSWTTSSGRMKSTAAYGIISYEKTLKASWEIPMYWGN